MLYIKRLTVEEIVTLEEMHKNHPRHLTRNRAHRILLSYQGYSVPEICAIYNVCRQTVSTLFHHWERDGLCGLVDRPGRGRPSILTKREQIEVIKKVEQSPRSLKKVIADLTQEAGISISTDTLRLICKRAGLVWKRVRKSLRSKRNQDEFDAATTEIKVFIQQHKNGEIDLCYCDESGFTLESSVPYAWQPIGKTIEVPSSKSKRLNVLGFVNRDCRFDSFVFDGSITTAVVVSCLDWFANQIKKPTILLVDNASIHTSAEFNQRLDVWKENGLIIHHLPSYSPELNIIEIIWRRLKYEWLPFEAYLSLSALKQNLCDVLSNIGSSYVIKFS
jgi:transposase